MYKKIQELLGDKAERLLNFNNPKIKKESLNLPSPDFVDKVFVLSDRNNRTIGNLQWMYSSGRLAGTGYLSILPVDQGIEHSA
ncbi:MAG: fructose-bisphosphate aldolase, partial [Bacteroidota bacterium]